MNRKMVFAMVAVALVIGAVLTATTVPQLLATEDEIVVIGFDCDVAREHVELLVENGPRMSASEAEQIGAEYIVGQYEAAGCTNCHIETYSVNMFQIHRAAVELVPYGPLMLRPQRLGTATVFDHTVDYVLQGYSGSRSWTTYRDDLAIVPIGNGAALSSYTIAADAAALIAMDENTPGNPDVYQMASEADVAAIILQNGLRGEVIGYPPMFKSNQAYEDWSGDFPEIPFFMVSKAVGDTMEDRGSDHKLRLDLDIEKGPMDICVTVGEIVGSQYPDEYFIVGAHHDTCYNTIGVVDNTVGPAIVCELAAQLAQYNPKYTIRFCTWGGEEEGLYGSTAYFAAHEAKLVDHVHLYSNFDMSHTDLERSTRFLVTVSDNSSKATFEQIRDKMTAETPALDAYNISFGYDDGQWAGSDQWPFASHGIDVTNAWGGGCHEYHTYLDDLSHLNEESLQLGGRLIGSYIVDQAC